MGPALKKLGFLPYSFKTVFQGTNVRSHPEEWSALLSGVKPLDNLDFLKHYDCLLGPPSTVLYDRILKLCPPYTKVILIEEPNKKKWAETYNNFLAARSTHFRGTSSSDRVRRAYHTLIEQMMVGSSLSSGLKSGDLGNSDSSNHPTKHSTVHGACSAATRARDLELFEQKVQRIVPQSRLLVFRDGDGWEPLCQFLGVDVKNEPFPEYDRTGDDFGLQVLRTVEDRLDRVKLMHLLIRLGALCVIFVLLSPYVSAICQSVKSTYSEYRQAYSEIPSA